MEGTSEFKKERKSTKKHKSSKSLQTDGKRKSPGPTLQELLKEVAIQQIKGTKKVKIQSITLDSRQIIPGSLFFAISGFKDDGNRYISEAIRRGAKAIVSSKPLKALKGITCIEVEDDRLALAQIARTYYKYPDKNLNLIGVTGTNGKTTVTSIIQYLLQTPSNPVGLIGTIRYDLGNRTLPATKTTPEALDLYNMFGQMVAGGCKEVVMEVSSHAIALKRIQNIQFNSTAFLNLTSEHLDLHGNMEAYFTEKRKLFTGEIGNIPSIAVINIDDPYGKRLLEYIPKDVRIITFSINQEAMFRAKKIELKPDGAQFELCWPGGSQFIDSPLLGDYNVSNVIAALGIVWANGYKLEEMITKISKFPGVRGRMEKVNLGQPFTVLVDYAHTDDALHNGLQMLKQVTPNRLLVVFGCGGNRDRTKRPKMTAAVQKWADLAWATADNPRKELVEDIFNDMKQGITDPEKLFFVNERRRAIDKALDEAQPGDCVVIAGKGHESYQILGDTIIPFDDYQVAKELLTYKLEKYASFNHITV